MVLVVLQEIFVKLCKCLSVALAYRLWLTNLILSQKAQSYRSPSMSLQRLLSHIHGLSSFPRLSCLFLRALLLLFCLEVAAQRLGMVNHDRVSWGIYRALKLHNSLYKIVVGGVFSENKHFLLVSGEELLFSNLRCHKLVLLL